MINYCDAEEYIENIVRFTTKNSAEHTRECLELLGNPDRKLKTVHVAGTNGKGSTCAFLSSVFTRGGFKTALFTSPHMITIRDRFRINGVVVSEEEFLDSFEVVRGASLKMQDEGLSHPTYFEFLFLMACHMFEKAGVDIAVMETGLGGRLDATNTLEKPEACIITSISHDHMQYLGSTIGEIAAEKAGIIKAGVPVIYDDSIEEASRVIEERAYMMGSEAIPLSKASMEIISRSEDGIIAKSNTQGFGSMEITIPFAAEYQVRNGGLALLALSLLKDKFDLDKEVLISGFQSARWTGRMQRLAKGVFVDGAHNEDGVKEFVKNAAEIAGGKDITIVFAVMADKEYDKMIGRICKGLDPQYVITTKVEGGRAKDPSELAELFYKEGAASTMAFDRIEDAIEISLLLGHEGYVFFAGSLYFVGEVLKYFGETV